MKIIYLLLVLSVVTIAHASDLERCYKQQCPERCKGATPELLKVLFQDYTLRRLSEEYNDYDIALINWPYDYTQNDAGYAEICFGGIIQPIGVTRDSCESQQVWQDVITAFLEEYRQKTVVAYLRREFELVNQHPESTTTLVSSLKQNLKNGQQRLQILQAVTESLMLKNNIKTE